MVSVIHDDFLDTKKDMDTIIYLYEFFNNIVLITLKKKRMVRDMCMHKQQRILYNFFILCM